MEFGNDAISYASLIALITVYRYYRATRQREIRTAQLERGLAQAELRNLRLQLQPCRSGGRRADRNYVRLHGGGVTFTLRGSIGALANRLDPEKFLRINRSEIVRLDAVKELQPTRQFDRTKRDRMDKMDRMTRHV